MATFEEQVEGLTGLTIGSSPAPSSNVFTDMLREGVRDVVNKMIVLRPEEMSKFTATTDSGAGTSVAKTGKILSVMREHASTSILRKCTLISPNTRYEATDPDSLFYRSEINPGYYELSGSIHTVPVAAESGHNNVVVTQVAYDAGLIGGDTYGGGNIANFPVDYEHLVALYAAIQSLQAAMSNSVVSLSISSPVTPVLTSITFTSIDSELDASAPVFTTATISAASTYTGSAPSYTNQVIGPDFAQVNTYVDTNQDVELASAKLQEIGSQIQEMNAKMQDSLNTFNKENVAYQSAIQESMQEMQASNQTNLAKAQSDLQLALSNKDRDLQRQLQNGVNDMQAIIADNQARVANYQAEVGDYQAEVAKEIQESTTKTQQYQGLYVQLLQQYNGAFQVAQPQQQGAR